MIIKSGRYFYETVWETIGFDRNCECVGREYTISVICRVEDDIIGNDLCGA